MKVLIVLALATFAHANVVPVLQENTAYGYIQNYAIPLAEKIREAEEQMSAERIVGGFPSYIGNFTYQAGLLANYANISSIGVCGGSLVSANRVITAAHCWFDGINQGTRFTVVLGSTTLFTGGTRIASSVVAVHPNWSPAQIRNDLAMIYLQHSVNFTSTISPIALPFGDLLWENYVGDRAVASGYGLTSDSDFLSVNQTLNDVSLTVIPNNICLWAYPNNLQESNLCTSGDGENICTGDSGGPLAVFRNGSQVLIGVASFFSGRGCEAAFPAVFARVTSFMDFINQHIRF